jgi:hypothetical protein
MALACSSWPNITFSMVIPLLPNYSVVPGDLFLDDDESNFYFCIMAYAAALKFHSSLPDYKFV